MENLKKNVVTCAVLRDEISGDDDRYRESDEDSNYLVTKNATDDKGAVEPARELAVIQNQNSINDYKISATEWPWGYISMSGYIGNPVLFYVAFKTPKLEWTFQRREFIPAIPPDLTEIAIFQVLPKKYATMLEYSITKELRGKLGLTLNNLASVETKGREFEFNGIPLREVRPWQNDDSQVIKMSDILHSIDLNSSWRCAVCQGTIKRRLYRHSCGIYVHAACYQAAHPLHFNSCSYCAEQQLPPGLLK